MTLLLPTLAVAFAAFCVWLTVRIVNRRERWAKWTAGVLVGLPALYVLCIGPACWIYGQTSAHRLPGVFLPLEPALSRDSPFCGPMLWFAGIGMGPSDFIAIPEGHSRWYRFISRDGLDERLVGEGNLEKSRN